MFISMLRKILAAKFTALILALTVLFCISTANADELSTLRIKMAITEALAQYPYRWDSKNTEGFSNLFTEDAVMERWLKGKLVEGSRLEGKPAILEYAQNSQRGRLADRQTRHHFSGLTFLELSETHVITENMALITHQTAKDSAARISSSGIYRISWRHTAQGWKISKRLLFSDSFPSK